MKLEKGGVIQMLKIRRRSLCRALVLSAAVGSVALTPLRGLADEAERAEIDAAATASLAKLYAENKRAEELSKKASGLLIFPKITKAGLGIGAEGGKGVLRVAGQNEGYYKTRSLSFGAQAGIQTFGYVIMFLTPSALDNFRSKKGFELGVDGSVAVLEAGVNAEVDTTNIKSDTVGIVFDQTGLMANISIEGSKISKLDD